MNGRLTGECAAALLDVVEAFDAYTDSAKRAEAMGGTRTGLRLAKAIGEARGLLSEMAKSGEAEG